MTLAIRNRSLPAMLLLAAPLAACAGPQATDYPSLERRAVEFRVAAPAGPPVTVATPATADLATALAALEADAQRGDQAFAAARESASARILAGAGAARESEAWVQAQLALSALEHERAPSTLALAEVDRLLVDRGIAAQDAGWTDLTALQARLTALVADQDRVLAALAERFSR